MKGMLKWPLIIAAILVVGRIIVEQGGAPGWVANLFSVVILYVFVAPIYFAFRIANSGIERPYRTLLKKTALFTALARSMVIPTYWLAYHFQWTAPRFSVAEGGNVGPNVPPIAGYVFIPLSLSVDCSAIQRCRRRQCRTQCAADCGLCLHPICRGHCLDPHINDSGWRAWIPCDQVETKDACQCRDCIAWSSGGFNSHDATRRIVRGEINITIGSFMDAPHALTEVLE
jgi:hypothetical protein